MKRTSRTSCTTFILLALLALAGCGAVTHRSPSTATFSAFVPEVLTSEQGFVFPPGYTEYVAALDNQQPLAFTSIAAEVGVPAESDLPRAGVVCGTTVELIDESTNAASAPLFIGYGGSGASDIVSPAFIVPANHGALLAVIHGENCASQARDLNIAAEYSAQ